MREKRRKEDKRLALPAWCEYLVDPGVVPLNREDCPCTKRKCERRGRCRECYGYHAMGRRLPYCLRRD